MEILIDVSWRGTYHTYHTYTTAEKSELLRLPSSGAMDRCI